MARPARRCRAAPRPRRWGCRASRGPRAPRSARSRSSARQSTGDAAPGLVNRDRHLVYTDAALSRETRQYDSWGAVPRVGERRHRPPGSRRPALGRHPPHRLSAAGVLGHRPLLQGRVHPPDRVAQAPPRPLAVPLRVVQRLDRPTARPSWRRRRARRRSARRTSPACSASRSWPSCPRSTSPEKVAMIEHYGGRCHLVDDATTRVRGRPAGWRPSVGATTWTSSPTPSGPPTGAATTTSPSRCSSSWRGSGTRCRRGS